jgi:glycosyltransferase involved in cell wall biosynthesis
MTRADAVIVNSAFTRDHVLAQHRVAADRLALIPEGVDPAAFDPVNVPAGRVRSTRAAWGIGEGRTVILVAARLTGWKGHRLIIEALAQGLGRERAHLVFVGRGDEGPYAAELAASAARAGVALTIAGPSNDMPASFLAADLVAAPSLEPESFGRTVAEAGAMARVVLASALGGPAETIVHGQTGFLVLPGDAPAWSAALDRALAMSPAERAATGGAARERIETHYSTKRMCEATFALYRRLSESKS